MLRYQQGLATAHGTGAARHQSTAVWRYHRSGHLQSLGGKRSAHLCSASGAWTLFELDGAVVDMHMDGHRVAFNSALIDMGYECAQFTPPIYNDLLQVGDGTAEGMVKAYFDCMGWPQMLPTSERGLFTRKICQEKAKQLSRMLKKDHVKLRAHVDEVIRDALKDSMHVGLIAGTQCDRPDEVAASVLRQLGPETSSQVKVFTCTSARGEEQQGQPGRDTEEHTDGDSLAAALRDATAREKQQCAAAFINTLKNEEAAKEASPVLVHNQLLAASNKRTVTPEYLAALVASLGTSMSSCLLVASSLSVAQVGCAAGMATVAVPRRMAFQGSFPDVAAKMEGYGSGNATWPRLKSVMKAQMASSA